MWSQLTVAKFLTQRKPQEVINTIMTQVQVMVSRIQY